MITENDKSTFNPNHFAPPQFYKIFQTFPISKKKKPKRIVNFSANILLATNT